MNIVLKFKTVFGLSVLASLFSLQGISKPYEQKMLSSFIKKGKDYDAVVELKIEFTGHGIARCSGVKTNTPQGKVVVLTAAHCLQYATRNGQVISPAKISVGSKVVSEYFEHPFFESAPQYDIAALLLSDDSALDGLNLYDGAPERLLQENLIHVGYGKIAGRKSYPRQAFKVFPNRATQSVIEQSPFQDKILTGEAGDGDSGGPLLFVTVDGQRKIAGVFSWYLGSAGSQNTNQWTLVTADFISLLDPVFFSESSWWSFLQPKNLINKTPSARKLWLQNAGKNESWDHVADRLRSSAENQYYLGMVAALQGNTKSASEWFEKADKQNYSAAQYQLGIIAQSTAQNTKAVVWFSKAADAGMPEALFQLAGLYALGVGVKKDLHEAVKYYQEALKQGPNVLEIRKNLISVATKLAEQYYDGDGLPKDLVASAKYYEIAAQLDDEIALQNLRVLRRQLKTDL